MSRIPSIVVSLVLATSAMTARADEAEVRRLRETLALLTQEQQSVYQQFQMVQALRAGEQSPDGTGAPVYTPSGTLPSYDEIVRQREAAVQRRGTYQAELDYLFARYRELEEQKRPLVRRLSELAAGRPPAGRGP